MKASKIKQYTLQGSMAAIAVSTLCCAPMALSDSLDSIGALNQGEFRMLAETMGAATHYKSLAPVEPLGTLGFDIGVEVSSTDIEGALFDAASSGDFKGTELLMPRLHAHKGLPFGLDIGASISQIPDSDLTVVGGELRYSWVDGNAVLPAIGVRLSHSEIQGADELDFSNSALELGISKGLLLLTPYAGVGLVKTSAEYTSDSLTSESFSQRKIYAGVTLNLGVAFTIEVDNTGDTRTYSAKAGIRF